MSKVFNNITTKEALLLVPLPLQSRVYRPVSHQEIIEATLEGIDKSGFNLSREIYYSGARGNQMLGRIGIDLGHSDIKMEIAFHNSYDKSLSLKFCVGERVTICENGACSGSEGAFKAKHSGQIQTVTPEKIQLYLENIGDKFQDVLNRRDRFRQIEITKKTCSELLGRLYVEEEIINSTQLAIVKGEMINPSFNYQADGTLWDFWGHLTYSMSETNPRNYIDKSLELFKFVEAEFA